MDTADEVQLLAATRAGDEQAFGQLAARHRPGLERFCGLMLGCPAGAHEAVCETLLRCWSELRGGTGATSARLSLYRVATDVCLQELERTDEPRGSLPLDGVPDDWSSHDTHSRPDTKG